MRLQIQESVHPYIRAVTPADDTTYTTCRAILVKSANLGVVHTVTMADGTTAALGASMTNGVYPLAVSKVLLASGSTMNIILLY